MTFGAEVLAAKLFLPRPRPGLVARPRLTQRLETVLTRGRKLAVVVAPAGYGKTTLLAEWLEGAAIQAGWVSLDGEDNDPARFAAHIITALAALQPGAGEAALAMLNSPQSRPNLNAVFDSLANDLAAVPAREKNGHGLNGNSAARATELAAPFVLVLDDFHLVTVAAVHAAASHLLDHLPPNWRLVVAGREEPSLPLARLRARGEVVEVGPADLSFTLPRRRNF
jgi:LuxR family maltose regulon positive regulatory protein